MKICHGTIIFYLNFFNKRHTHIKTRSRFRGGKDSKSKQKHKSTQTKTQVNTDWHSESLGLVDSPTWRSGVFVKILLREHVAIQIADKSRLQYSPFSLNIRDSLVIVRSPDPRFRIPRPLELVAIADVSEWLLRVFWVKTSDVTNLFSRVVSKQIMGVENRISRAVNIDNFDCVQRLFSQAFAFFKCRPYLNFTPSGDKKKWK